MARNKDTLEFNVYLKNGDGVLLHQGTVFLYHTDTAVPITVAQVMRYRFGEDDVSAIDVFNQDSILDAFE